MVNFFVVNYCLVRPLLSACDALIFLLNLLLNGCIVPVLSVLFNVVSQLSTHRRDSAQTWAQPAVDGALLIHIKAGAFLSFGIGLLSLAGAFAFLCDFHGFVLLFQVLTSDIEVARVH